MLVVIRSGLNFVLARFDLALNSTYVTYVLTGIIVVAAVLMDVIKNKNAAKVKIDTDKTLAKKQRRHRLSELEDEIDGVFASELPKEEKAERVRAIEAEIAKL